MNTMALISGRSQPAETSTPRRARGFPSIRTIRRVCVALLLFTSLAANAQENSMPVNIKALCDDKVSSIVLSSLKEQIDNSAKYRLVRTLTDDGQMDIVLTIDVRCVERNN